MFLSLINISLVSLSLFGPDHYLSPLARNNFQENLYQNLFYLSGFNGFASIQKRINNFLQTITSYVINIGPCPGLIELIDV